MTCIFNQCHNYNELRLCCSKLIHTFFELILALCLRSARDPVWTSSYGVEDAFWVSISHETQVALLVNLPAPRWRGCSAEKHLAVSAVNSFLSLHPRALYFSPSAIFQIARPSSWRPTLALKWRNTALISCLALSGECKKLLVIDDGRPTRFRRSRSCE